MFWRGDVTGGMVVIVDARRESDFRGLIDMDSRLDVSPLNAFSSIDTGRDARLLRLVRGGMSSGIHADMSLRDAVVSRSL